MIILRNFRHSLLIVSIVFTSLTVFSQPKTMNKTDSLGRKQGYWKKFDEEGHVKYEGNFKDNYPVGEFRYFYPSGKMKARSVYTMKGKVSYTLMFDVNEKKMAEGKYVDEKKDSTWRYYNDQEQLISEETFQKGLKHGIYRTYYPGGTINEEIHYLNGKKDGEWIQYYADGIVKLRGIYRDDLLQGLTQVFYPNSKVMVSGTYKNSLKDGIWMYFDESGKAQKKEIYAKGHKIKEEIYDKSLIEKEKEEHLPERSQDEFR